MGTVKLYQTKWNNISLLEIAKKIGKPLNQLAGSDVYREFYHSLKENNWLLDQEWEQEKIKLGELIFSKANPSMNDSVISLGAGIGICEMSEIRGGIE